jgi:hypothetical protein
LGCLLALGESFIFTGYPLLDFVSHPRGVLFVAAALALINTDPGIPAGMHRYRDAQDRLAPDRGRRGECVRGMISHFVLLEKLFPATTSAAVVLFALFVLTMVIKIIYGSSMAAFVTAGILPGLSCTLQRFLR